MAAHNVVSKYSTFRSKDLSSFRVLGFTTASSRLPFVNWPVDAMSSQDARDDELVVCDIAGQRGAEIRAPAWGTHARRAPQERLTAISLIFQEIPWWVM